MKKLLVSCLMILVALNLLFPMTYVAATPTTYEDDYTNTIEESFAIVPNILINEVGTLKVTISWITPSLTFERAYIEYGSETISYYVLKESKEVKFKVKNESIKSTDNLFNGNIKVTPNYTTSKGEQANNIFITLTKENKIVGIMYDNTNEEIILKYTINDLFIDGPLSANLTPSAIASILTANVIFKIEKQ